MRILGDFANSQILDAALEYDFFTLISKGFNSAEAVAREAGTDARATRIVLDSLPALSLIEKRDGKYFADAIGEAFLVKGKPSYCGDFRHVALALWDGMAHLKESLKTGKPLSRMDTNAELQVWEKLVLGIIVIAEPAAKALCDILKIGSERKGHARARHRRRLEHLRHDHRDARSDGAGHAARLAQRQRGGEEGQQRARPGRQDSLHRRRASHG